MTPNDLVRAASAPCLLIREEDLPGIQAKIASHRWAQRAYQKLIDAAHSRIAKPIEVPDRGGQWPHWYACQSCGTQLVTESSTVHRCPSCDLVNSGEPWDSVPLTRIHNQLSEDVRTLGVSFALSEEKPFAEKAAEILMAYAEAYPKYPVRDHNLNSDSDWATKVSWGTLGESVWLIPVCCGYDLIRHAGVLSPAEHHTIREQLIRPAAQLILKHNIGIHNIQCWHNCAVGMAGLMVRDPELLAFTVDGDVGVRQQIHQGILPDGFWHEGSWGYHFYGLTPLLTWTMALRNCGLDLLDDRMRGMFESPLKAVRPDGGMPAFHDSGGGPLENQAHQYEIATTVFEEPRFSIPLAGSTREGLNALLYGMPDLPDSDAEIERSEHLPDSGFVFSRQGAAKRRTYVAFDYGPHGGGHGHPDKLGFTLFAHGRTQATDPGSVAYGVPIHQQWYKQTVSHNTIVVDGQSQAPTTGALQFLVHADGLDLWQADAGEAYEGVRLQRTMVVAEDVVLLIDRARSDQSHTYDWVYHNRGQLRPGFSRRKRKTPLGETDGYEVIQDLRCGMPEGPWTATWKQDRSGVRVHFVESKRDTEVFTGEGPANIDGPGIGFAGEDVPFVFARRTGRRRTTFAAALQLFGARPAKATLYPVELEKPERGRAYRYTSGATDLTLVLPFLQGTLTCEDLTFRGLAALVDRKRDRMILCEGESVEWNGHHIEVHPAGSIEMSADESGTRITNLSDDAVELTVDERTTSLPAGRRWRVPND